MLVVENQMDLMMGLHRHLPNIEQKADCGIRAKSNRHWIITAKILLDSGEPLSKTLKRYRLAV